AAVVGVGLSAHGRHVSTFEESDRGPVRRRRRDRRRAHRNPRRQRREALPVATSRVSKPRQAVIAGVHLTKQARRLDGRTSQDLALEAVRGALDDAGLSARDVDGVALDWSSPAGSPIDAAANWAPYFRQPLAWVNSDPFDRAGARAVAKAAAAIEFGLCD